MSMHYARAIKALNDEDHWSILATEKKIGG